jgi:hypothetical protein
VPWTGNQPPGMTHTRLQIRTLVWLFLLGFAPANSHAIGSDQLYTGDAWTVPPGKTQALVFTDATWPARTRLGGIQLRPGVTGNVDAKIAYSYLWNFNGPNAQFGPNVGLKWRFAGNGLTDPSLAVSTLYAINTRVGSAPHKNDIGATLIGSCPVRNGEVLADFGHVWAGDNVPDLRFVSFAFAQRTATRTLVALEYSSIQRLGGGKPSGPGHQVAAAVVYGDRMGWTYSAELGYLPDAQHVRWHATFGIGVVF